MFPLVGLSHRYLLRIFFDFLISRLLSSRKHLTEPQHICNNSNLISHPRRFQKLSFGFPCHAYQVSIFLVQVLYFVNQERKWRHQTRDLSHPTFKSQSLTCWRHAKSEIFLLIVFGLFRFFSTNNLDRPVVTKRFVLTFLSFYILQTHTTGRK